MSWQLHLPSASAMRAASWCLHCKVDVWQIHCPCLQGTVETSFESLCQVSTVTICTLTKGASLLPTTSNWNALQEQ